MIPPTSTGKLVRRSLVVLLAAVLASAVTACGDAGKATRSSASTITPAAPPGGHLKIDGDKDDDDRPNASSAVNDDGSLLRSYGPAAGAADRRTIVSLVKAYYASATAGDSAKACSLLYSAIAAQLAANQGSPGRRHGCPQPMATLLAQQHRQLLVDEVATMQVIGVHVSGDLGLAVLGFRRRPEGDIVLQREGRTWKIDALFDSDLT